MISRLNRKSQASSFGELSKQQDMSSAYEHQSQPRRLSNYLNLCSTILVFIGLVSALRFGIIAIVQSSVTNVIAYQPLALSRLNTRLQFLNSSVRLTV